MFLNTHIQNEMSLKDVAKEIRNSTHNDQYDFLENQKIPDESDDTRVLLNPSQDHLFKYDLANHIKLNGKEYIALGYPLFNNPVYFWEMMYEKKCPAVVKLSQTVNQFGNDLIYWPSASENVGPSDAPSLRANRGASERTARPGLPPSPTSPGLAVSAGAGAARG